MLAEAGLPIVDVSEVPRDPDAQQKMYADRAVKRYELGNVLFLAMNRPDSAAAWYRMVIEEDGEEPVAQRAYYALAEVQRALGDTLSSERVYRTILDLYPASDFAERSRERLGLNPDDAEVFSDTLALAEAAYDLAYTTWQDRRYEQSLNDLVTVAVTYPDTDVAPRALFAAGSVYMEWAASDSLDLFAPLPLALPDSVLLANGLMKSDTTQAAAQAEAGPDSLSTEQPSAAPVKQAENSAEQNENPVKQAGDPQAQQPETPVKQINSLARDVEALDEVPAEVDDSLAVSADSLAMPVDSLAMPVDSLGAPLVLPADSSETSEAPAVADSVTVPEPEPVRLETLFNQLVERYPRAPQTAQARRVLSALEERRAAIQAVADSLAAVADSLAAASQRVADSLALALEATPDSLIADSLLADALVADSLGADSLAQQRAGLDLDEAASDTLEVQDAVQALKEERRRRNDEAEQARNKLFDQIRQDEEDAELESKEVPHDSLAVAPVADQARETPPVGLGLIDWSQGEWTILIRTEKQQALAVSFAQTFNTYVKESGEEEVADVFPVQVDGSTQYSVGVGVFSTELEADEAIQRLRGMLPTASRIVRVPVP